MANTNELSESTRSSPIQVDDTASDAFDIESITGQARSTIVLHPGSSHLRLGKASDPHPTLLPHVIAWRHNNPGQQKVIRNSLLSRNPTEYEGEKNNINFHALKEIDSVLSSYLGRSVCRWEQIAKSNRKSKPEVLPEGCGWSWTDTSKKQPFLIGDDALYIDEKDCYDIQWPIVKGQLNVHNGRYGSLSSVITSLKTLWGSAIETFLHIPLKDLPNFRCVLLIPDLYNHQHVKEMVDMLLNSLKFSSIMIHQESVCSTYGCGIANACVVDVGHEKTSITCVEDGTSHKCTSITLNIGGRDVTRVFANLLQRNALPYKKFDQDDRMDALLMEELKETYCHLKLDGVSPDSQEFHIRRPGQESILYPISLGDETLQAPLSLFYPKVYGLKPSFDHVRLAIRNPGDSDDPLDEHYLYQTRNKQYDGRSVKKYKDFPQRSNSFSDQNAERMDFENSEDLDDEAQQHTNLKLLEHDSSAPNDLLCLHHAIIWSIENIPLSYEDELKRRMYSCILIVGGGLAHFDGTDHFLHQKIRECIPQSPLKDHLVSQLEVIVRPKDQDPSFVAWKGGSVLSCLESAHDCWVSNAEWKSQGLKVLRERCPFVW